MSKNKIIYFTAFFLLFSYFTFAILSVKDDSLTFDELSHLPAGYSYLTKRDYRLNPEHPPLIKDLAAFPLLFLKNINFPKNHPSWTEGVNNQWWFGNQFLFKSGNDADKIIFLGRIPMILLSVLLGILIFKFSKEYFNEYVALLVLFFFSFSPNFIAHGRLVTTDIGVTFGILLYIYSLIKFLNEPNLKRTILLSISLSLALLIKFSTILLLPFTFFVWLFYLNLNNKFSFKDILFYLKRFIFAAFLVILIISTFYYFHIQNYPKEKQISDTSLILESSPYKSLRNLTLFFANHSISRPIAQYILGLVMATQRTAFGNTVYYLGKIKSGGFKSYFPVVYLLKEPLSFHILTISLIFYFLFKILRNKKFNLKDIKNFLNTHFVELSLIIFILIYWFTSLMGNLNIGVRHIIPTFPLIYILISLMVFNLFKEIKDSKYRKLIITFFSVLIIWYVFSSIFTFPYYLSYFNELGGGVFGGYRYVVDSNYDWGQDLKRLKNWLENSSEARKIDKFYIDYFGGADLNYYFGEKAIPWDGKKPKEEFPRGNYLIVCANSLQGGRGIPVKGFDLPTGYYRWLDKEKLIKRVGTTLFVYYIP
ncbi:MAG: ArnT family glycosyltransferase [Minisyncoccia bacterium]